MLPGEGAYILCKITWNFCLHFIRCVCIIIHTLDAKECVIMKQLPVKKLLALGLGAAVSLSLLASCGGRSAETPAPESGVTPSAAQTAAEGIQ